MEFLYDPSKISERQMVEGMLTGKAMESVSAEMFSGSPSSIVDDTLAEVEKSGAMPEGHKSSLRAILQGVGKLQREHSAGGTQTGPVMSVPFKAKAEAVTARNGQEYDGVAQSFAGNGCAVHPFHGNRSRLDHVVQRKMGLWKRFRSALFRER